MRRLTRLTYAFSKKLENFEAAVWEGEVEVFDLAGFDQATRIYAWSYESDEVDQPKRTVTVLHIPPVTSPELAVRAAIVKDYREREENH